MTEPTARVLWRLHLASSPERVYDMLATDAGRARFWAESAAEVEGVIGFVFPGGLRWCGEILERVPPRPFAVRYYGGSRTTFRLRAGAVGGTDLDLVDEEVGPMDVLEARPGWVSVLLALKATADFGVDLRNHDPARTWAEGFCDN